jgi:hypothetical protein
MMAMITRNKTTMPQPKRSDKTKLKNTKQRRRGHENKEKKKNTTM